MKIVLILILLTLWIIACAICTAIGFHFGQEYKPKQETRAARDAPEPTPEEKLKAKKSLKETYNMLTYDGSEQPDIQV